MTRICPLGNRLLIRRLAHEEQRHGALWLPKLPPEAPMVCEVLEVGPGVRSDTGQRIPIPLVPGDKVLIGRWAGTDVHVNDEAFRILELDEVIGIVEGSGSLVVME